MPRRALIGAFKFARADSASWVCTPVAGSTNLSAWTTTQCRATDWEDAAQGFHRRPSRP